MLIVSRPSGIVLRSSGALFALPVPAPPVSPSKATPIAADVSNAEDTSEPRTVSDLALKYSKLATRVVESVGQEVRAVVDNVSNAG